MCIVLVVSDKRKAKASGITQKNLPTFSVERFPKSMNFYLISLQFLNLKVSKEQHLVTQCVAQRPI